MAKYQHWYIRGWTYETVLGADGALHRELRYRGEYYRPSLTEAQFREMKIVLTALLAVSYLTYCGYSLHGAAGGRVAYSGAGCILAIIPFIFQGMGIFSLWGAPHQMPFRNYYAAILRTKVASAFTSGLVGISAVGEMIFMVRSRDQAGIVWMDEWIWLLGCLVCAWISFALFFFLRRLHFDILPGEADTSGLKNHKGEQTP